MNNVLAQEKINPYQWQIDFCNQALDSAQLLISIEQYQDIYDISFFLVRA